MYNTFGAKFANFDKLYNMNILRIIENLRHFEEFALAALVKNSESIKWARSREKQLRNPCFVW